MEDVDLPPAFPEWLKRMFPTLRAEETNALFQAFRRRRLVYRRTRFERMVPVAWMRRVISVMGVLLLILAGNAAYSRMSKREVAFVLLGIFAITVTREATRHFRGVGSSANRLPDFVHETFGPEGRADRAAIDVWLAGTSARDVVETVYLELYLKSWKNAMAGLMGICMFVTVVYGIWAFETAGSLASTLVVPSFLIAGFFGCRFALVFIHDLILNSAIRPQIRKWDSPMSLGQRLVSFTGGVPDARRSTRSQTLLLKLIIVSVGTSLVFSVLHWMVTRVFDLRGEQLAHWRALGGPMLFAFAAASCAAFFYLESHRWRAPIPSDFEKLVEDSAQPLRNFIERIAEGNRE